ncbi:SMI1/KNR4 family protein [Pseudoalteromonas phenolica]|uniref:SMI1/KNR4 family protein n=1 Tax=Pseudoalteromonas phenolica TaxID=161398 RepID=A0A4Q7IPB1_9GAMM|nr:SMI1/KNR4 family protein [Pseudoalteromonas phenolica]RZQ52917.1 SMI1/KNR4 family protein [Pseudoalteromonas phenolica]
MKSLKELIRDSLHEGMVVPEPLEKLFDWIESNGFCENTEYGRVGYLYPDKKLRDSWTDDERSGGTLIEFYAESDTDSYHFVNEETKGRFSIFARTGGDGSVAAFWLDDEGKQHIVHVGSGSGSTLACILASDAVDFLRLIAIGYDEICWNEDFSMTASESFKRNEFVVKPNLKFQDWLVHEFNTTIPKTGLEVVKTPAEFGDEDSSDLFCRWLEENEE